MDRRSYRTYSTDFKLSVVRAYLDSQGGFKSLAKQHGISHVLIINWVRKFERGELVEEEARADQARDYEAKIASLERKVGQLVMEVDLLKKRPPPSANSEALSIVSGPPALVSAKAAK